MALLRGGIKRSIVQGKRHRKQHMQKSWVEKSSAHLKKGRPVCLEPLSRGDSERMCGGNVGRAGPRASGPCPELHRFGSACVRRPLVRAEQGSVLICNLHILADCVILWGEKMGRNRIRARTEQLKFYGCQARVDAGFYCIHLPGEETVTLRGYTVITASLAFKTVL